MKKSTSFESSSGDSPNKKKKLEAVTFEYVYSKIVNLSAGFKFYSLMRSLKEIDIGKFFTDYKKWLHAHKIGDDVVNDFIPLYEVAKKLGNLFDTTKLSNFYNSLTDTKVHTNTIAISPHSAFVLELFSFISPFILTEKSKNDIYERIATDRDYYASFLADKFFSSRDLKYRAICDYYYRKTSTGDLEDRYRNLFLIGRREDGTKKTNSRINNLKVVAAEDFDYEEENHTFCDYPYEDVFIDRLLTMLEVYEITPLIAIKAIDTSMLTDLNSQVVVEELSKCITKSFISTHMDIQTLKDPYEYTKQMIMTWTIWSNAYFNIDPTLPDTRPVLDARTAALAFTETIKLIMLGKKKPLELTTEYTENSFIIEDSDVDIFVIVELEQQMCNYILQLVSVLYKKTRSFDEIRKILTPEFTRKKLLENFPSSIVPDRLKILDSIYSRIDDWGASGGVELNTLNDHGMMLGDWATAGMLDEITSTRWLRENMNAIGHMTSSGEENNQPLYGSARDNSRTCPIYSDDIRSVILKKKLFMEQNLKEYFDSEDLTKRLRTGEEAKILLYRFMCDTIAKTTSPRIFIGILREMVVTLLFTKNIPHDEYMLLFTGISDEIRSEIYPLYEEWILQGSNRQYYNNRTHDLLGDEDNTEDHKNNTAEARSTRLRELCHSIGIYDYDLVEDNLSKIHTLYTLTRENSKSNNVPSHNKESVDILLMKSWGWPDFANCSFSDPDLQVHKNVFSDNLGKDKIVVKFNDLMGKVTVKIGSSKMDLNIYQYLVLKKIFENKPIINPTNIYMKRQLEKLISSGIIKRVGDGFEIVLVKQGDFSITDTYLQNDAVNIEEQGDLHTVDKKSIEMAEFIKKLKIKKECKKEETGIEETVKDEILRELEEKELIAIENDVIKFLM